MGICSSFYARCPYCKKVQGMLNEVLDGKEEKRSVICEYCDEEFICDIKVKYLFETFKRDELEETHMGVDEKDRKVKCRDCEYAKRGYFKSVPEAYVCTGVRKPFVISNFVDAEYCVCEDK